VINEDAELKLTNDGESKSPVLSVLMPVMNEATTLLTLIQRVMVVPVDKEIIVVDDGSSDDTRQLLQREVEGVIPGVTVLYHSANQGKGAALRTAIPHARGRFSIVQDGDLEYDPNDYLVILAAFQNPATAAVYGSRFLQGMPQMKLPNRIINLLLAGMVRVMFGVKMTDEATCYKAFRTELLQALPLTCQRFEFCPEVTAKALRRGYQIVEVPISYSARTFAEGKKIRWTDGVEAIWTLVKWRFVRF
jgi:glycosyltransferase involved in cell wall biosynthesis